MLLYFYGHCHDGTMTIVANWTYWHSRTTLACSASRHSWPDVRQSLCCTPEALHLEALLTTQCLLSEFGFASSFKFWGSMLAEFAHKHVAHACCACWFLMLKRYSHSISVAACEPDLRNSCRPCQKNKLILSQPLLSEQYDLRAHCEDVQLIIWSESGCFGFELCLPQIA